MFRVAIGLLVTTTLAGMWIYAASFLVSLVSASVVQDCWNRVECRCGNTQDPVTICLEKQETQEEACKNWRLCKSCRNGVLQGCTECPPEFQGTWCTEITQRRALRQKRQYVYRTTPQWQYVSPRQLQYVSPRQQQHVVPRQGYTTRAYLPSGRCPDLDVKKLGRITCTTVNRQRVCTGICIPGYEFVGMEHEKEIKLSCQNGVWTPMRSFPPCKSAGYCDLLVQNGFFNCTHGMEGTRCDVNCANRYAGQYFCYPGHSWDPPLPSCVRPKIPPENVCHCEYGGSCDQNGLCVCPAGRTGTYCESIVHEMDSCHDPGFIKDGYRLNMDRSEANTRRHFADGESVTFGCYATEDTLQGSAVLVCHDGHWSGDLPKCIKPVVVHEMHSCHDPGFIQDGYRLNMDRSEASTRRHFEDGESVVYGCYDADYVLQGSSILVCHDTRWSGDLPKCIKPVVVPAKKNCGDPGFISGGYRRKLDRSQSNTRRRFEDGESVVFGCNAAEDALQGSSILVCNDGQWSAALPKCIKPFVVNEMHNCHDPGFIKDGYRLNMDRSESTTRRHFEDGESVLFGCNAAEDALQGTAILVCSDGKWSAGLPKCIKPPAATPTRESVKLCRDPGVDPNGSRRSSTTPNRRGFPPGSQLEFSCSQNYDLEGERNLFCLVSGRWSAEIPICKEQPRVSEGDGYCPNPGRIQNGKVVYFPYINSRRGSEEDLDEPYLPTGSRLSYTCDRGYTLSGDPALVCLATGEWSGYQPICEKAATAVANCDNPGSFPNGRIVHLPKHNSRSGSSISRPKYPEGDRFQYSCNTGFTLEGSATLTCQKSGSWSSAVPRCRTISTVDLMYCDVLENLKNGEVTPILPSNVPEPLSTEQALEYPQGTRLRYKCEADYILKGPPELTCLSNGDWSSDPPKCDTECGISSMKTSVRVIHGTKTQAGEWPWVVAIATEVNRVEQIICGGAVLDTQTVVTAAHCLTANSFTLYFGKIYRSNSKDDSKVMVRRSVRVIRHPDFNEGTYDSDIGLIKFLPKIRFTDRVKPICLPTPDSTARNLMTGKKGYVTGWGLTEKSLYAEELLLAQLPYLSNSVCNESYKRQELNLPISQNMFCAGFEDGQQAACSGDSGSPIVFYNSISKHHTLEGLVSFGVSGQCGLPGRYTVFTKVFGFGDWILRNMS